MELILTKLNGWKPLNFVTKSFILDFTLALYTPLSSDISNLWNFFIHRTANYSDFDSNSQQPQEIEAEPPKKRGHPKQNREANNQFWEDDEVFILIDTWSRLDQLYNCQHPKYHLRDEKLKSIEKIRNNLAEKGIEVTTKQIADKFLFLRNYYSARRRKEEAAARKSGSGRDDLYQFKWQFYRYLGFLKDTFTPRNTESNFKRSNRESSNSLDNNTSLVFGKKSGQDPAHARNRVVESMESIVGLFKTRESSASTLQHPKSEDEIFGEMVIKMIAKITVSEERYLLKLRIQQDIVQMLYSLGRGRPTVPFTPQGMNIAAARNSAFMSPQMTQSPQSLSDHFP